MFLFLINALAAAQLLYSPVRVESLLLKLLLSLLLLDIILLLHVAIEVVWCGSEFWPPWALVMIGYFTLVHLILLQGHVMHLTASRYSTISELSHYRAIVTQTLLILAVIKKSSTVMSHESTCSDPSRYIFHPWHWVLTRIAIHNIDLICGRWSLAVVGSIGTARSTHNRSRSLRVVLTEILKSLPKVTPKFRHIHRTWLLLFPIRVV